MAPDLLPNRSNLLNQRNTDVVRLILQSLNDLGYSDVAKKLEIESGLVLESKQMISFRNYLINGDWDALDAIVDQLDLFKGSEKQFKFNLRKQKFIELLQSSQLDEALEVLQRELTPLRTNIDELHQLSLLTMCSIDEINRKIDWQGIEKSRNELLITQTKFILPSMCIPPNRLNILLDQALQLQRQNCLYHNEDANECLLVDHSCQREKFPNHTTHLLEEHRDEVWFMAFSHDGTKLASASRDARAIIWDVENFKILYVLDDHKKAISYLSWSPDDSYLLTASNDTTLKLWNTKTGQMIQTFSKHTDSVTSCVWHPSGSSFVSGSVEKNMYHWNINGEILFHWPGVRIMDLAMTSDGKKLIACSEKRIRVFDFDDKSELYSLTEHEPITSVCLSKDDKFLLVNLSVSEIHLWNLKDRTVDKKYFGQKQGRFVIRSCLGGIEENFVLSGSEDYQVYVWHRELGTIIENLPGHSACVNCVAWNPKKTMFASASDDQQIRIWGPGVNPYQKLGKEKLD